MRNSASTDLSGNLKLQTLNHSNLKLFKLISQVAEKNNQTVFIVGGYVRDLFENETPTTLVLALATGSEKTANVMTFVLPLCKLSDFSKSDAELGIMATASFTALLNTVTTGGLPASTIQVVDTMVV